jgi:hypothetical protein
MLRMVPLPRCAGEEHYAGVGAYAACASPLAKSLA